MAWGYIQCVPSPPLLVVMHTFSTLATKALSLLLEVKDWIHATAALFIEAKDVLVGLVSRSTTALRHQARSALFAFLLKGGHNDLLLHMDSQDLKSWLRDNNDGVAANEDDPTSNPDDGKINIGTEVNTEDDIRQGKHLKHLCEAGSMGNLVTCYRRNLPIEKSYKKARKQNLDLVNNNWRLINEMDDRGREIEKLRTELKILRES